MKKLLVLLLVVMMVLPLVVACQEGGSDVTETTGKKDDVTEEGETRDPYLDDVPEGLDYEEHEFVIAAPGPWGDAYFNVDDDDGDTINSAIYSRNRQIEERFNIIITSMNLGSTDAMASAFSTYKVGNEDVIDLLAVPFLQSGMPMITSGYVLPWNDVEYIDPEKPYWHQSATTNLSLLGNYYFLSGSINWNYMGTTMAYYFNKVVADQYKDIVGDPYQLVRDDEWTFDKMFDQAKHLTNDLQADGKMDTTDQWGLLQYKWTIETHLMSTGKNTVYFDPDPEKNVVFNINTYDNVTLVQKVHDLFWGVKAGFMSENTEEMDAIFFDDRALYYITTLEYSAPFRAYESDFGILPPPKYSAEQETYWSYSDQWGLPVCFPSTATNPSRTGAIVEALCSLSHRTVVPAYYERTLLGKIKRDDESEEMLDIIFANVLYDIGNTFATSYDNMPLRALIYNGKDTLTSWFKGNESKLKDNYKGLYDYVYDYNQEQSGSGDEA